jgi:UDP-N-acetylmuramoyl-tripeptide--D-alanyl-D-alanine ligase
MERVRLTDMAQAMNAHVAEFGGGGTRGLEGIEASGVSTDSRTTREGDVFFAIRGDCFDGHDFVEGAAGRGACAAVVSEAVGAESARIPTLVVGDTVAALQDAAGWYRDRFELTVVGVTGTNGKTTTKDMAAAVLATGMSTARTLGNFNNHIGVPLTLFGLERAHEAAVVEMGMNHSGEITRLAGIARPSVGVITNVAEAHLETMRDLDTVARAKGEILEALPEDGTSVLNGDDERVMGLSDRGPARVITFGTAPGADVRAESITEESGGVSFRLEGGCEVELPVPGRHNVMNALAAIAVGRAMGVSEGDAARGLHAFEASPMRMSLESAGRMTILNDAYNCNPGSLSAALRALVDVSGARQRAAALGDMLELGDESERAHRRAGVEAAELGVDRLYLFGTEVEALAQGAVGAGMPESRVGVFEDKTAIVEAVRRELDETAVLLVKGSRGMRMEEVVELLTRGAPAS